MFEQINTDRLKKYLDNVRVLDELLEKKQKILEKFNVSGVDYSKDRVTNGGSPKHSDQERCAIALQKINKQIDELRPIVIKEHDIIKTQISRIKKYEYRKILVYRYLEKWKWSEIIQEFFEFESDYEDQKNDKYHTKIMYWHRRALEELQKVSKKPIVEYKQLSLEVAYVD